MVCNSMHRIVRLKIFVYLVCFFFQLCGSKKENGHFPTTRDLRMSASPRARRAACCAQASVSRVPYARVGKAHGLSR